MRTDIVHTGRSGKGSSSISYCNIINNMAWRSSGSSNDDLVEQLWRNGLITDERVKEAFRKVSCHRIASLPDFSHTLPLSSAHPLSLFAPAKP